MAQHDLGITSERISEIQGDTDQPPTYIFSMRWIEMRSKSWSLSLEAT